MRPILLWLALLATSSAHGQVNQEPPRLTVLIVVDQLRSDYLERFGPEFRGGFRRLLDEGAVYPNAYHDHSATETAVGHSTIATGIVPSRHGIVGNDYYDHTEQKNVLSVEDTLEAWPGAERSTGRSPRRLQAQGLGDFFHASWPESKVVSVSLKDRASILSAGFSPNLCLWYSRKTGLFESSPYYGEALPGWVETFNSVHWPDSQFTAGWQRYGDPELYTRLAGADAVLAENDAVHTTFPHTFSDQLQPSSAKYYSEIYATPFGDQYAIRLAQEAVSNMALGSDSTPDYLFIGCSSADAVGHRYGPDSHEILDHYLRLDGWLGELFGTLDSAVGADNYLVVLSSDHGVLPLPELLDSSTVDAGRISYRSVKATMTKIGTELGTELGLPSSAFVEAGYEIIVDYDAASAKGISARVIDSMAAVRLRGIHGVADVFTRAELNEPQVHRPYIDLYRNVERTDRGTDLYLRFRENYLITDDSTGTTHGSPHRYDTHVPIIFSGPNIKAGQIADSVRTVDIAPTISELVGLTTGGTEFSGRSLAAQLRRPSN